MHVEIPLEWENLRPGRLRNPPFALKWGKVESLEKPFLFTAKALKLCSVGSCKIVFSKGLGVTSRSGLVGTLQLGARSGRLVPGSREPQISQLGLCSLQALALPVTGLCVPRVGEAATCHGGGRCAARLGWKAPLQQPLVLAHGGSPESAALELMVPCVRLSVNTS